VSPEEKGGGGGQSKVGASKSQFVHPSRILNKRKPLQTGCLVKKSASISDTASIANRPKISFPSRTGSPDLEPRPSTPSTPLCFGFLTSLFGIGFLIYYGFQTTWWAPLVLLAFGLLIYMPFSSLEVLTERFMPLQAWGLLSFVAVPVCAVLLIYFTP
jgi:hypothetical protein